MIHSSTLCVYANLALGLLLPSATLAQTKAETARSKTSVGNTKHSLRLIIREQAGKAPIPFATVQIPTLGIGAVADINGVATLRSVPRGRYIIELSSMGYARTRREVLLEQDLSLTLDLKTESLGLEEITVTAKRSEDKPSTSSTINRQAIDHLQAMSLADVVQLVPGQLLTTTDLTTRSSLQLRSVSNNLTSALGTSVVIDGVPQSTNGLLSQGGFSSTAFAGTDLRTISADDLESVEVVRGIPSAEYGDLTSGLMITKSRVGVSPWSIRAKLSPSAYNLSASKGLRLGEAGILNMSVDYAEAYSDPRQRTRSYDRYNLSLGYTSNISPAWHTTTKLRYGLGADWSGQDPDAIADGTSSSSKNHNISLSHNGKLTLGKVLSESVSYTLGLTQGIINSHNRSIVAVPSGALHIISARETGYHVTPIQRSSYLAGGGTESKPFNLFAKVSNQLSAQLGKSKHQISMGLDYSLDYNSARGYYNDDELLPLRPNSNGRPRAYTDIPAAHRLSAYLEDNMRLRLGKHSQLRVMAGLRFTSLQPGSSLAAYSLSPRLNTELVLTPWLSINAGIGWNAKTPGLDYLYPDKKYTDNIAVNYNDSSNPAGALVMYHSYVQSIGKSRGLKNATSRKIELGTELKLGKAKLNITAYEDYTPNGFSSLSRYASYSYNLYTPTQGLTITPGSATMVDWANPAETRPVFVTTGEVGNTSASRNRGLEVELELGEIKALRTQVFLSGAYAESKTWETDLVYSSPKSLPSRYTSSNTTPFLLHYPSGVESSVYRRALTTLRLVTHIPELRMVASFTGQVLWYNYSHNIRPYQRPLAYMRHDLVEHSITPEMLADDTYMIDGVPLKDQLVRDSEAVPTKQPITWQLTGRLTKELGKRASFSLFANNLLYYEPYLSNSTSSTLTQRSTGAFSYGVELSVKL